MDIVINALRYDFVLCVLWIVSNLQVFSPNLCLGNQEDAHEFLMLLLDAIHKSVVQCYGRLDANMERTAFVYQIFGGQRRSQLRCRSCNAKSDTFGNILSFSIDLQKATPVYSALEDFIKVDIIGDNDPDTIYLCNSNSPWITTLSLCAFETFYLRFTCGYMQKANKDIKYDEVLDMAPYVSEDVYCPSTAHQLYAVLVLLGHRCDWGHYFAYVKAPHGNWFRMDDEQVSPESLDEVLSQQVYMLFYTVENHTTTPVDPENQQQQQTTATPAIAASAQDIAVDEKTTTAAEMFAHVKNTSANEKVDRQQLSTDSVKALNDECEYFMERLGE
ncbi:hypothetical protein BCR42DRAFT_441582 [Absidia repens]|uniref:ubiquitinyl hydrolase 1 n=1 Tax=Absidia repens TaxID=90262 RepID=A0A1X2I585_9FUNG|nr:hypothetical protein BCR42DRAFT_441582 [Absidia repens]